MILDYKSRAKDLLYSVKKEAVQKFIGKENIFHQELKNLLQLIYPNAYIEILQGANEKGKEAFCFLAYVGLYTFAFSIFEHDGSSKYNIW